MATHSSSAGHLTPHRPDRDAVPFSVPSTPSRGTQTVGFIGLGNMGGHIARNVATYCATHKAGAFEVLLYNRTKSKAEKVLAETEERLAAHGGLIHTKVVDTMEELIVASDFIVTSMGTDDAMLAVAQEIARVVKESQQSRVRIVVDTSTLYPSTTGKIDQILTADANTHFVSSPVFGPPVAAKEAKLIVCLAGDYASKKKVAHLLVPAAGKKVIDLGGNVEKASAFKLLGNSYISGTVELLAQSHTFAEKIGIGSRAFHDWLGAMFPAPLIQNYSRRMVEDDFDGNTGFNIDGGLKDIHHMQRLSQDNNVPIPITDLAQQHLLTAKAVNAAQPSYKQIPNLDWSGLIAAHRVAAGLHPFDLSAERTGPVPE